MSKKGAAMTQEYRNPRKRSESEEINLTGLVEKRNRRGTRYLENGEGELVAKECSKCAHIKSLEEFNKNKKMFAGRRSECRKCQSAVQKNHYENNKDRVLSRCREYVEMNRDKVLEWRKGWRRKHPEYQREYLESIKNNPTKFEEYAIRTRINWHKRRARKRGLPNNLTKNSSERIVEIFSGGCALTESKKYHMDHVIPLATGHGGTTYENMVPISGELNISKNNRCIFDWFAENRERFNLSQTKFDDLIEYLADINGITVKEYEEYVRWCHDNPRTIDEIKRDQRHSIEIWREAVGKQYPLPAFTATYYATEELEREAI